MKAEYDFSRGIKNPHYAELHEEMTVFVDKYLIKRLEEIATEHSVSVQRVVNSILNDYTLREKSRWLNSFGRKRRYKIKNKKVNHYDG
jgi:hypothetical protein